MDVEFKAKRGDRYMIEFEFKEDVDMFQEDVLRQVFGDTLDKIMVLKFWLHNSDSFKESMMETVDKLAEEMKYQIKQTLE